jgi:threonine/homoserine/homoserine lactone efflux protein
MHVGAIGAFLATATALLGSPGPGIAALVAVGRAQGWSGGLRYFVGLQLGLAAAVVICAAGVVSLSAVSAAVTQAMNIGATIYLLYLSYAIATAPVGAQAQSRRSFSPWAGLWLGITNPKAYLAISSLLASPMRLAATQRSELELKSILIMTVIVVVDIVWLWIGVVLRRTQLSPAGERIMNVAMGVTIVIATACSL